jgi:16S rRNA (cytosine967-C5)-methyltransferase
MSRYHSYLNSAKEILGKYTGEEPFAAFLKKYFAANKKFGSRDRKQVAHLCYCFFRLGKMSKGLSKGVLPDLLEKIDLPLEEKTLLGLFLCSTEPDEILQQLKPEWNEKTHLSFEEKCSMINDQYSILNLFPWQKELSKEIDTEKFSNSFLIQPDLFLRIRPSFEKAVRIKLLSAGIAFEEINNSCLSFPNATKLDEIIELDKEAVVQDYSSQKIGDFLKLTINNYKLPIRIWDCCAASGGKSILAKDVLGEIDLTVSDVRENILANLRKRFEKAGIKKYRSFEVDLSNKNAQHPIFNIKYSIIIADLPCTGSGTWSRTPEQLYFFNEKKIDEYAALQKKIVSNVIQHLQPGGYLLYITCSVFKNENEEVVDFIKEQYNLTEIKMELLKGYAQKADSMFAALLQKPL